MQALTTFQLACVPFVKVPIFRALLEAGGYDLPTLDTSDFVKVNEEISNKRMSLIFDGMTHLGKVLAMIVQFVNGWTIKQRLV